MDPYETKPSKFWQRTAIVLVVLILGFAAWYFWTNRSAPPTVVEEQLPTPEPEAEVVSPEVSSLEELKRAPGERPIPEPTLDRFIALIEDDEHIRGNADALISIIEFAHVNDQYARLLQPALKELTERRNDVNVMFRHFPLEEAQPEFYAAVVSECVYLQLGNTGFWNFMDLGFEQGVSSNQAAIDLATSIGTNDERLQTCMYEEYARERIIRDLFGAQGYGQFYTEPSFFFYNNKTRELRFMQGAEDIGFMEAIVDDMIQNPAY